MGLPLVVECIIFSIVSVLILFVISKLLGKKQIAQLEFIDYVLGISIGSIAANMATDTGDTPFYFYIIGMAIFFLFDLFISWIGRKGVKLKQLLKGKPITIIYEGDISYKNLKNSKLDMNDLLALCREQGYFNVSDIAYAVFETNGNLSILPKENQKPVVSKDINIPIKKSSLTNYLVVDGNISYSGLNEINKDETWLFKKLGIKQKKELKNIILALYDDETGTVIKTNKDTIK